MENHSKVTLLAHQPEDRRSSGSKRWETFSVPVRCSMLTAEGNHHLEELITHPYVDGLRQLKTSASIATTENIFMHNFKRHKIKRMGLLMGRNIVVG